ncbi:MAG: acetate--CoA ligase family protein [Deltaproteobacteria bacterium]|nr:acetate--CoA ligase family protein [Deltaproteobacteria bacterium]
MSTLSLDPSLAPAATLPDSEDLEARKRRNASLDPLFFPRSVAVVGASRSRGTIGGEIFHNLISDGFPGPVYPVNPTAIAVQSVRASASVREIPGPVDLAIIVVPRDKVLDAVDDCHEKGVKGLVVISAGFKETGPSGKKVEDQLVERVRRYGMRMVGPNCMGLLNTDPRVKLNATFAPTWPPSGNVAFSSQSGALGLAILDYARELGIGISTFVSMGNKADVSGNDLLEYWEADPATRVILLYLESLGNPVRFMQIARRVGRTKPIVVVKSGRTEAGARAASSHTGAMAGTDVAVEALLHQAGVIRTDTIEELFDTALILANQPAPKGNRVAILTNAGGPGIMASDACESRGLKLPSLSASTDQSLRSFLPPEASTRNPVDMIASASATSYEKALRLLLEDEAVDSVIVLFVPPIVTEAADVAFAIRRAASGASKPVITCFMGTHGIPEALSSLREGKFPSYSFPEAAAIALSHAVRYGRWRGRPEEGQVSVSGAAPGRARATLLARGAGGREGRWLNTDEVRQILGAFGISMPVAVFAQGVEEAASASEAIGFPVAVKLASRTIVHKTDVGGVILGIAEADGVRNAVRSIEERLEHLGKRADMDGVIVQQMVPRGVETFVGVTQVPHFGKLIGFGIGGVNVEIWNDVVFRVHPLTRSDAEEMVEKIRGAKLLRGFRGAPSADREALVDTILRISALVEALPELQELDINPLVARPPGEGVIAVDARIRVAGDSV